MPRNILTNLGAVTFLICHFTPCQAVTRKALNTQEVPSDQTPKLNLSEDISSQIYTESKTVRSEDQKGGISSHTSLGIYMPSKFILKNQNFSVDYTDNTGSISGAFGGPEFIVLTNDHFQLNSVTHFGFFYDQGIYHVESESGLSVQDEVALQWIPIQTGMELSSKPLTQYNIAIGIAASAGVDWLTQTGKLDGMNQSFFVPQMEIGPVVTMFSRSQCTEHGFDGIQIALKKYASFASNQQNRGNLASVGAKYAF
ncbi:MAG: hypothetical protein NT027_08225 [Proteobacteria bacterium]|nr:hypothetical protein [Pseudomonadota bacterium]